MATRSAPSPADAYLAEGEAAVVVPRGAAGFRLVARVRKDEWSTLRQNVPGYAPPSSSRFWPTM